MTNSVVFFILLPLAAGMLLLVISSFRRLSLVISCLLLSLLVLAAFLLPKGLIFDWMDRTYEIKTSLILLGRAFTLPAYLFPFCGLVYLSGLLWSICSELFMTKSNLKAMCLIIPALLLMMVTVDPFLYSAVIFEILALLAIPLLLEKKTRSTQGILHFIVLQTIAMALVLLSAWMLTGVSTAQSSNPMILRGAAMVLIGFMLWFPAFPFHVWMAELFKENHPWPVSFLLTGIQTALPILLLVFIDRFAWLKNLPGLFDNIKYFGLVMIAIAGIFSSFQRNFRRQTAYLYLNETGYTLLIIGLAPASGLNNLAMILLPHIITFWFWAYCLSILETRYPEATSDLSNLNGFIRNEPLLSLGLVLGQISFMGLPMLALFPIKRLVWFSIPISSGVEWLLLGVGAIGMLAYILRLIMAMLSPRDPLTEIPVLELDLPHPRLALVGLLIGLLLLLAFGFFPQLFLTRFIDIISPFLLFSGTG
ncbi:MAG TPA: proton-conducting transporter membrane subunit [Anaerolineaceae bacterium]|nr:proton-conducting transporter membrane subunit [Anaerolineaceae bacterium]